MRLNAAVTVTALAAALLPTNADAETMPASTFRDWCNIVARGIDAGRDNWAESPKATFCMGYFNGILAEHRIAQMVAPDGPRAYCLPRGVTPEQMMRVFTQFARENPQDLHRTYDAVALASLVMAFPCQPDWQGVVKPR